MTRARELNQLLGPKASGQAFDFVLDLHNTKASMGTCLIAESAHNVFAMHLCRHLQVAPCLRSAEGEGGEESTLGLAPLSWGRGWGGVPPGLQSQGPATLWTHHRPSPRCSVLPPCSPLDSVSPPR